MPFEWSSDVEQATWWTQALHPFAVDVGSVMPDVFPAYARVLHPVDGGLTRRTWSEIAAENGRIAHAEMQFHQISRPVGAPASKFDDYEQHASGGSGSLHRVDLEVLAALLARRTKTSERCWCCVWDGFGQLHGGSAVGRLTSTGASEPFSGLAPREVRDGPKVEVPSRAYYLLSGPLVEIGDLYEFLWQQSPNVWWPDDRAWFAATEIDFSWTYVGGSAEAIDEVLADPRLEAFRAEPTHKFRYDSDVLNAGLDAP